MHTNSTLNAFKFLPTPYTKKQIKKPFFRTKAIPSSAIVPLGIVIF